MASMSFFSLGLQIVFPYSRIGLTLDLKRNAKISLLMNLNVRLIIPITWLTFFTVLLMCSVKVNRSCMVNPRSFSAVVFLSSVVWPSRVFIVYLCSQCRCPILIIFHVSGRNFSIHFCDHASGLLMSRCRDLRSSSTGVTARYSILSSANNLIEFSTVPGISLMNVNNRTGPRTIPCGTPLVTFTHSEQTPFTETC